VQILLGNIQKIAYIVCDVLVLFNHITTVLLKNYFRKGKPSCCGLITLDRKSMGLAMTKQ
jgi:hypothetical protein